MMGRFNAWLARLENDPKWGKLVQFIKFGVVGVSNTAISYAIEMLCYYVIFKNATFAGTAAFLTGLGVAVSGETVRIIITNILSFFISVTNSYYWNSRYVFKAGEKRTAKQHAKAYLRTVLCYGVTGLLLAPAIKLWLSGLGTPYWLASLASLIVTIPLNFVLNKYWAFREKGKKEEPKAEEQ